MGTISILNMAKATWTKKALDLDLSTCHEINSWYKIVENELCKLSSASIRANFNQLIGMATRGASATDFTIFIDGIIRRSAQ